MCVAVDQTEGLEHAKEALHLQLSTIGPRKSSAYTTTVILASFCIIM
jgi:hypothetical protein